MDQANQDAWRREQAAVRAGIATIDAAVTEVITSLRAVQKKLDRLARMRCTSHANLTRR